MKKIKKITGARIAFACLGIYLFLYGIINHDWYFLIGGFLLNFDELQIVHWQGVEWDDGDND